MPKSESIGTFDIPEIGYTLELSVTLHPKPGTEPKEKTMSHTHDHDHHQTTEKKSWTDEITFERVAIVVLMIVVIVLGYNYLDAKAKNGNQQADNNPAATQQQPVARNVPPQNDGGIANGNSADQDPSNVDIAGAAYASLGRPNDGRPVGGWKLTKDVGFTCPDGQPAQHVKRGRDTNVGGHAYRNDRWYCPPRVTANR